MKKVSNYAVYVVLSPKPLELDDIVEDDCDLAKHSGYAKSPIVFALMISKGVGSVSGYSGMLKAFGKCAVVYLSIA